MRNKYLLSEFVKTSYSLFMTKIFFSHARLIRRPIYIRGKKSISGGKGLTTGRFCRFDLEGAKKTLVIGDNCEFGDMTHIVAYKMVEIGNNVLIASKCFISDTNHGNYKDEKQDSPKVAPNDRKLISKSVKIGNNVWIGENVVILPGVKIGDGSIIGANSVVTKDVRENAIAVGAPTRVVKVYNSDLKKWEKI